MAKDRNVESYADCLLVEKGRETREEGKERGEKRQRHGDSKGEGKHVSQMNRLSWKWRFLDFRFAYFSALCKAGSAPFQH